MELSLTVLVNSVAFRVGRFVHAAQRFQLHAFGHGHLVVVAALHGVLCYECLCLFDGFFFKSISKKIFSFGPLVDADLLCLLRFRFQEVFPTDYFPSSLYMHMILAGT